MAKQVKTRERQRSVYVSAPYNCSAEYLDAAELSASISGALVRSHSRTDRRRPDGYCLKEHIKAHVEAADEIIMVCGWMFDPMCVQEYAIAKENHIKIILQQW